jgi:hypothetical protein
MVQPHPGFCEVAASTSRFVDKDKERQVMEMNAQKCELKDNARRESSLAPIPHGCARRCCVCSNRGRLSISRRSNRRSVA